MSPKAKNITFFCLGIIIIAVLFLIFQKPDYPDTFTAKPIKGNHDASVKIVEFSDLQCPACGAAHPVVKKIMGEYETKVSLEYKHFPLTSIHLFAFDAAVASECANDQGKFWEYIDIAFANQNALQKKNLKTYAEQIGLNTETFDACLASGVKKKYVSADMNEGIGKNVQSTPSFFINGKPLDSWQYEKFKAALDAALAEAR